MIIFSVCTAKLISAKRTLNTIIELEFGHDSDHSRYSVIYNTFNHYSNVTIAIAIVLSIQLSNNLKSCYENMLLVKLAQFLSQCQWCRVPN